MRKIWKYKWLVIACSAAIFLSIGAVAWAATGDDATTSGSPVVAAAGDSSPTTTVAVATGAQGAKARLQALKQKRDEWIKKQQARIEELRTKMSAEDQATLDKLLGQAKGQRDAILEARQNLKQTLKEVRELCKKYLPATTTTTN